MRKGSRTSKILKSFNSSLENENAKLALEELQREITSYQESNHRRSTSIFNKAFNLVKEQNASDLTEEQAKEILESTNKEIEDIKKDHKEISHAIRHGDVDKIKEYCAAGKKISTKNLLYAISKNNDSIDLLLEHGEDFSNVNFKKVASKLKGNDQMLDKLSKVEIKQLQNAMDLPAIPLQDPTTNVPVKKAERKDLIGEYEEYEKMLFKAIIQDDASDAKKLQENKDNLAKKQNEELQTNSKNLEKEEMLKLAKSLLKETLGTFKNSSGIVQKIINTKSSSKAEPQIDGKKFVDSISLNSGTNLDRPNSGRAR